MNNIKIKIWNRYFTLPVTYDIFPGETISKEQNEAIKEFVQKDEVDNLDDVIDYCKKSNPKEIQLPITNIFKYVMPQSIFVYRKKNVRVIMLLCDYKFDEENGIEIVYENGKLSKIGPQDLIA